MLIFVCVSTYARKTEDISFSPSCYFTSQRDYLGDGNVLGDAMHCQIPCAQLQLNPINDSRCTALPWRHRVPQVRAAQVLLLYQTMFC